MSDTKWTPGKWFINSRAATNVFGGPNQRCIASCGGYSDNRIEDCGLSENVANAQLIAAAPDLYEALAGLERSARKQGWDVSAARAALAKARGES